MLGDLSPMFTIVNIEKNILQAFLKFSLLLIRDSLMGEGFILLTRGYGFMGGMYHPPFDTLKIDTSTDDIKLKLYR